jgi:hypothetical protein
VYSFATVPKKNASFELVLASESFAVEFAARALATGT